MSRGDLRVFIVAGEHSGDILGAKLMRAMRDYAGRTVVFGGVGGEAMEGVGLRSLFPLADVAVMGPFQILKRLAPIVRRVYQTVDAALAFRPDVVVIVDSPEFTHPIAKRIRRRRPDIPIVDYVSPSVWAWRPGRARKMKPYVDHVLGLLPFEPEAHLRLGGPLCSYVGHSLVEELDWIDALDGRDLAARLGLALGRPVIVALPGSRRSEAEKLLSVFGEVFARLNGAGQQFEVILPTLKTMRGLVEHGVRSWRVTPHLVEGREDMFRAFKLSRCALAASGTVTLELAAAKVPMVVGYRVDPVTAVIIRPLITAHSTVLPNLVLGENVFPEFHQQDCTADKLCTALMALLDDTAERQLQLAGLERVRERLLAAGGSPSAAAARIVLNYGATSQSGLRDIPTHA